MELYRAGEGNVAVSNVLGDGGPSEWVDVPDVLLGGAEFIHIVLTYSKTTGTTLYVDGEFVVNANNMGGADLPVTDRYALGFVAGSAIADGGDGYYDAFSKLYPGTYDDVKVYNYGLDAYQAEYLYTGQPVCMNPPVYDFTDDCIVSLDDIAVIAGVWLDDGFGTPTFP